MRRRSLQTTCDDSSAGREGGTGAPRPWFLACVLAVGLLGGACTGESSSPQEGTGRPRPTAGSGASAGLTDNQPAVILSARLQPDPLTRREPITVIVEAKDPEGGAVRLTHQWYLNGEPLEGQIKSALSPSLVDLGDQVSVEITPYDAKGAGTPYRATDAQVVNTPPKITRIIFKPFPVRVGSKVTAEAETDDPDGDDISYEFRWFHNGEEVLTADRGTLSTAEFVRGDEIVLEVTPSDGTDVGEVQRSDPVVVDNSPPEISSTPPREIRGGLYSYALKATDRDGDELTYSLETGPPGMSIDPKSGVLKWTITPDIAGTHQVRVAVSDGHVTEPTVQEFNVALGDKAAAP